MQILTLVVQNTVAYSDLGTATSGVTFFRTLGGSFGASIMGSIYSNQLKGRLAGGGGLRPGAAPSAVSRPGAGAQAPGPARGSVVAAYAAVAPARVPVRGAASRWSRSCSRCSCPRSPCAALAQVRGVGDGFAVPEGSDNEHQLANVVGQILRRDNRSSLAGILARSGSGTGHRHRLGGHGRVLRQRAFDLPARESDVEARVGVPPGVLRPFFREVVAAGYLTRSATTTACSTLTQRGQAEADKLAAAWQAVAHGRAAGTG